MECDEQNQQSCYKPSRAFHFPTSLTAIIRYRDAPDEEVAVGVVTVGAGAAGREGDRLDGIRAAAARSAGLGVRVAGRGAEVRLAGEVAHHDEEAYESHS